MTRAKVKKPTKDDATRVRRRSVPWDSDRVSPDSPSSLEMLMTWFKTPGNAERWRREKRKGLLKEIIQVLEANGIQNRAIGDVHSKIWYMENQFTAATALLTRKGQLDAFQRGLADPKDAEEVLKLCPQYRELLPIFGRAGAVKKTQTIPKGDAMGVVIAAAAADKRNGTKTVDGTGAGGKQTAAGEWKKSLENDRRDAAAGLKRQQNGGGKQPEKKTTGGVNGDESIMQRTEQSGEEKNAGSKTGRLIIADGSRGDKAEEKKSDAAVAEDDKRVDANNCAANVGAEAPEEGKPRSSDEHETMKRVGQQDVTSALRNSAAEEAEEGGAPADVDDGQSDGDENKQSDGEVDGEKKEKGEDEKEEEETTSNHAEAQDDDESEDASSEGEKKPRSSVGVKTGMRSPFKIKLQQSASEESSSEEEESDDDEEKSESEQEEDADGEERIPLAQPDEVDATPKGEEIEQVEQAKVDEENDEQTEIDDGVKGKADEPDEIEDEKEVEEEPEQDSSKAAADSSDGSSCSSNENASDNSDTEEEVPPTQLKTPTAQEAESEEDESKNENNDKDDDMEEDSDKPAQQRDSDTPTPVEQSESDVESESPVPQRTARKRSSSSEASSSSKRSRADSGPSNFIRDLERQAFIERAKQERDQREELFKLERAKLECELQAKQLQLAMERSLARKKLLSAGIDPAEVDRVLPVLS